jgi:hypothetical protein
MVPRQTSSSSAREQHHQPVHHPTPRNIAGAHQLKILLNKNTFEKLIKEKLFKHGLNATGNNYNEIILSLNNGLEFYLKNILEKLIQINRARNVNLNLYTKFSERDPMFKIHTFNYKPAPNHQVELVPYSDFSIVFTKNMKNVVNTLESYEDLMAYKSKIENITTLKTKIEEIGNPQEKIAKQVGPTTTTATASTNNIANNKSVTTKATSGKQPRRKRTTTILKNYKNAVAKTQKKNEIDRQKKDTQNTLNTFLDNKPSTYKPGAKVYYPLTIGIECI